MGGSGQDAIADALVFHMIEVVNHRLDGLPLVETQVVDHKEEDGLLLGE